MGKIMDASVWNTAFNSALIAGSKILAAGRELKIGYSTYDDVPAYAEAIAEFAMDRYQSIADAWKHPEPTVAPFAPTPPPPWNVPDTTDDVPF